MNQLYVVGLGPGKEDYMTKECLAVLEQVDVIVGYPVYLDLIPKHITGKERLSTPMRQEKVRCQMAIEECKKGKSVAMVCSGDSGVYGMASLLYEMAESEPEVELVVVPGITAAISGSARLGSPLSHDFCVISLSNLLTPWEVIEKRLRAAVAGDFCMAIYNPASHKRPDFTRRACEIFMEEGMEESRACGYVKNIGREGEEICTCTLRQLMDADIDMFTTVFIGNSNTKIVKGKLVTPRGYQV